MSECQVEVPEFTERLFYTSSAGFVLRLPSMRRGSEWFAERV